MVRNSAILRCQKRIPLPKLLLVLRVDAEAREVVGWLPRFESDASRLGSGGCCSLGGDVVAAVGASDVVFKRKRWRWSTS